MKKSMVLISMFLLSGQVFSKARVYCKDGGEVINVLAENGWHCNTALILAKDVCFTGDVKTAVNILNSQDVLDLFDGTDGEYIHYAAEVNQHKISYISIDHANEWAGIRYMRKCSPDFFKE